MDFSKLAAYVDRLRDVGVPGCDLAVYRDHEPVFRRQAGFRDAAEKEPMRGDETYWLFSCTKVLTSCAAMQLIEEGKLHPDDSVSRYLPAYAHLRVREGDLVRPAERVMTVRHLMSMQSGLSYDLQSPAILRALRETGGHATTREIADALAEEPLSFEPGTDFLYSLSHDVLAAVIEAASGQKFSERLKERIFDPLDIHGFTFSLREKDRKNLCAIYEMTDRGRELRGQDSNNYRLSDAFESGGAGLAGNVNDYIRFADALACGGVGSNGAKILSPEMLQLWCANQLTPASRRSFDAWNRQGYSYALGVRTRVDNAIGGRGPIGEFGWDGAAGAWSMVDCEHHVSAYFGMHVRNFGYSYDVIHPTIRSLIYEGLEI